MADKQEAEQKPQAVEAKKEPKKIGTLESVVNETSNFLKKGLAIGLAAAIPFAQASFAPTYTRDTAILAGAQVAADATTDFKKGKKYTAGSALESSLVGTAITAPTYHMFDLINKIPTDTALGVAAKASAWGGLAYPAYIGMYQFVDYVIKNRTLRGVGKYIKENYWSTLKKAWKYLFPISLLNIFFVPPYLQIPISTLTSYLFALFGAPKKGELKEEEKRDKTPYLAAAASVGTKLVRNTVYGLSEAVRAVYSGIRDKFYKTTPATPAPAAQAAPAH